MEKIGPSPSLLASTTPWSRHALLAAIPMLFFTSNRLIALSSILRLYATAAERTVANELAGILLGLVEDAITTALLLISLAIVECAYSFLVIHTSQLAKRAIDIARIGAVVFFVLLTLSPFAADALLVRIRDLRFTTQLIETYRREKNFASSLEIEPREVRLAIVTAVGTLLTSAVFAAVYFNLPLIRNPESQEIDLYSTSTQSDDSQYVLMTDQPISRRQPRLHAPVASLRERVNHYRLLLPHAIAAGLFVLMVLVTVLLTHATTTVVAAIALNATLNELFRNVFSYELVPTISLGIMKSARYYLHPQTEIYELFKRDVLFRKTSHFRGPLAFDVAIDSKNPPNVLVIAVESFRYMDSRYLAEGKAAGKVLETHNLTLTPNFDRWAKRGVAFNNMWSSYQTSRSLEAILFGQLVYDSITDSGTTTGRMSTKLSGLPQFFKQKNYETMFTSGCTVSYDQWDLFLPTHGFDVVHGDGFFRAFAPQYNLADESNLNGVPQHLGWGVHDDLSFAVLANLILNKTQEQAERVERGEPKLPFFLTHYTISSHVPYDSSPAWFDGIELPDFSPLCEGWEGECQMIKKYAKVRYFTDFVLGRFLDRLEQEGVLNDTIVVVVGDHGQSPEKGGGNQEIMTYQTATTHVAGMLLAEGRLGDDAGLVIEDATHHYDLLNTLMDIVGVPTEGFLQTGIGRSLKRAVRFGERLVYSNNPLKKMSVVQGHKRFVYDRVANDMGLFDTVKDPLETNDELPELDAKEKARWLAEQQAGRELSTYFKDRWVKKCLTQVEC